jgi:O-antigen ligase/tetratricopeptide (TPR) repeat protein
MIRSESIARISLTLLFTYLFSFGATFNGILIPELKWITLGLMGVIAVLWGWAHWRGGWTWHTTPLDLALVLWGVVFVLSLAANLDAWRRIVMGLWYISLYGLIWYLLTDALANQAFKRAVLVDAILFGGLIIVFFGYFQAFNTDFDLTQLELPRPGSLVGNPNSLGAFLVVLGTLTIGRAALTPSRIGRVVLGAYGVVILALLLATFSRGAWLGMAGGLGALVMLALYQQGNLSVSAWRAWWARQSGRVRAGFIGGGLALILVGGVLGALVLQSLDASGRSVGLRTQIYDNAATIFAEKPLTGHGAFTFGREFLRFQPQPPRQPHAHAHNGILHIGAEFGLPGLVAFGISTIFVLLSISRNLQLLPERERAVMIPAMAALFGWGVHHLFDFPAMMPLIALMGLLVLVISAGPLNATPLLAEWRQRGHPVGIAVLTVGLLASGVWSTAIYSDYRATLVAPFAQDGPGDFRAAADQLDAVVAADPDMPIYHAQQGYLYGIAAFEGDESALEPGIRAWNRFVVLEPDNAIGWANLGVMYRDQGDIDAAEQAFSRAVNLAPASDELRFNYARVLEARNQAELARIQYDAALDPNTRLWPEWDETALSRAAAADFETDNVMTQTILALAQGGDLPADAISESSVRADVVQALVALRAEDLATAASHILAAEGAARTTGERAWVQYGQAALLAASGGDPARELDVVRAFFALDYNRQDYLFGINIPYFQFLRYAIPKQTLPGLVYPLPPTTVEPGLRLLLANVATVIR